MSYVGNPLANAFSSRVKQDLTGQSGTSFTLSHAVSHANDLSVYINHVRQEPTTAYSVNGTTLTTTGSVAGTDDFYIIYDELAVQSISHPSDQAMTATSGTFTSGLVGTTATFSGAISGTLGTAAQPNITSTGTLTSFRSTGIDDNANALAMTIDSDENIGIGTASPASPLGANYRSLDINSGVWGGTVNFSGNSGGYIGNRHSGNGGLGYYAASGQGHHFATNGSTTAVTTINSDGRVGIGVVGENGVKLEINAGSDGAVGISCRSDGGNGNNRRFNLIPFASGNGTYGGGFKLEVRNNSNVFTPAFMVDYNRTFYMGSMNNVLQATGRSGINLFNDGSVSMSSTAQPLYVNRDGSDGNLVRFFHDTNLEGNINVSGTNVYYNGFSGSHWSRLADNLKPTILKGTVVETIDEMCDWYQVEYEVEGKTNTSSISLPDGKKVGDTISFTVPNNPVLHDEEIIGKTFSGKIIKEKDNKHVKCKISDTAESTSVYGVFSDWDNDDDTVNDMYIVALGSHVVRIHKDQTVSKGDLITSNGDGTAKKQDDDIIRSKTIGKVLTNIKQETYSDGSYTVPCSLYCG